MTKKFLNIVGWGSHFFVQISSKKYCLKNGAEKQDILLYRPVFCEEINPLAMERREISTSVFWG